MTWGYLIVMVVVLVLGIALAPKPQAPRAAEIDDFDFPTAEEGRPIPVVFGEVDIRGSNILWYGDLRTKAIKKRSGFSKSTVGYKYHISTHQGLCHGPVDAVTNALVGDKQAWAGDATSNTTISINAPDLFGGEKREGGIIGDVDICMGGPAQAVNSYLNTKQGGNIPAYRGILGVVTRWGSGGMYIGTTAYPKPWAWRVRRILQGWNGGTVWYSSKAAIGTNMNPAHIIYQCLTDPRWGMGVDSSLIGTASFEAVADQLFDEGFGLSMIWNQSASIEKFLQIILDHIAGGLTLNNSTGQYELLLVRGDYDIDTLDEYSESDIIRLLDYQRQGWGETVNEVTLVYTDPTSRKDTTISQQDLANVDAQGFRVPTIVQLKGIRDHEIAKVVLARELAGRVTPLSKVVFEINRRAWGVRYGGLFKLFWSPRAINGTVYRVLKVSKGTLRKNSIRVECLEDIYALGVSSYLGTPSSPSDPAEPPTPPDQEDTGNNVIDSSQTAPPGSPSDGDSYFIPPGATGDWAGHEGEVADYDADDGVWIFTDVPDNTLIFDEASGQFYSIVGGVKQPPPWTPAIPPLTEDTTPDLANDFVVTYDTSASAYKKVKGNKVGGSSPTTTKGDLIVRGDTADDRLPVGASGYILTPDPTEDLGVKWTPPSALQALYYNKDTTPAGDTIANTTTETTFESFFSAIAGNQLAVGDRIIIKAAGIYGTTGTPTLRLRIKLGSTTVLDTQAVTLGSGISSRGWVLEGVLTAAAVGASGAVEAQGWAALSTAAGTATHIMMFNTSTVSVDTSAAKDVAMSAEWGTANAANTVQMRQMSVTIENVRPMTGDDPLFSLVQFLSGFEGADGSTSMDDESNANRTITPVGTAQIDTAQFKFGMSSLLLDGNSDYISLTDDASLSLAGSDFCIEGWIRFASDPSGSGLDNCIASHYLNTGNQRSWFWRQRSADTLDFGYSTDGSGVTTFSVGWNPAANTWYHVAITRQGSSLRMFVNGTLLGTHSIGSSTLFNSNQPVEIGRINSAGFDNGFFNGWIDELRLTIGAPRYTTAFTPPTAAFPRS